MTNPMPNPRSVIERAREAVGRLERIGVWLDMPDCITQYQSLAAELDALLGEMQRPVAWEFWHPRAKSPLYCVVDSTGVATRVVFDSMQAFDGVESLHRDGFGEAIARPLYVLPSPREDVPEREQELLRAARGMIANTCIDDAKDGMGATVEEWNRWCAESKTVDVARNEAECALGRLFNYNTSPDGASAERDRLTVLRALRSKASVADRKASFLLDYLCDSISPGEVLLSDGVVRIGGEPHQIECERYGHTTADYAEGDTETPLDAIERDFFTHATEEAKAAYRAIAEVLEPAPVAGEAGTVADPYFLSRKANQAEEGKAPYFDAADLAALSRPTEPSEAMVEPAWLIKTEDAEAVTIIRALTPPQEPR